MAKEETGRLLSKVAKFVRNPLKDWSELDADESSTLENGYSREMLKEMIERRQRNDFVRRREFDMLRKLRQREAAGGRDPAATPSSFNVSSTNDKSDGRALTLKKIDEIEEQMSQQWWKGRDPRAAAPGAEGAPADGAPHMAEQHARAYADTVPGVPQGGVQGLQVQLPAHDGSIEEAAIRYAHGDDAGAEAILLQALAPDSPTGSHDDTWRTLLDLYRATGDAEKFEAASTRYAQRMKQAAPEWLSFRALASSARAATPGQAVPAPAPASDADWPSPPRLAREGLIGLTRALGAAGPSWRLDWSALDAIEPDAAGPLRALFTHWADSTVQLRFRGGDRLLLVLAEATPANDRGVDAVWWQLHMAALRVMHRGDEFELLALNYCITYEVSPPPWEDPKGDFASLDAAPAAAAPARAFSFGADEPPQAVAPEPGHSQLVGDLIGESLSTWQRLDAELGDAASPVVSCAALVRIDFAAAGTLLNWVSDHHGSGRSVHFTDVHRLAAAFFDVIGIADHASVALRKD
ncbi:STAS domain-containing protein [Variovorax ginsengisoli]|uniref:STAS domain-containing protein n=1 Tax=Variovorax ginsengisoli TaxID=363844 RepID=A0ABT8SEI1_9BURK|nr:STAS domain-containing protein [Variovorax ginsengisoli]MDN8616711.1 STAS domain-containing protein [Variovorax ginsengisoli]MDO1535881.1 STAS domain-containing protein [Variovorax ginsengisoli]